MFDVRFGLKQDVARRDSRVADYCRWFLKGKSGQAPTEICPEDADFVAEWQKKVNALIHRAEELAKAGEGRGGMAFDRLKKDSLTLADEVFTGSDRGVVFGRVAQTFDSVATEVAQGGEESKTSEAQPETWHAYPRLEPDVYRLLLDVQKYYGWGDHGANDLARAQKDFLEKCPGREDLIDLARANGWLLKDLKEQAYGFGFRKYGKQKLDAVLGKVAIPRGLKHLEDEIVWRSFEAGVAACQRKKEARALVQRQKCNAKTVSKKPVDVVVSPSSVELKSDSHAEGIQLPTVGHPNSILNLKPSKKWVIVSDETGTNFGNDAFAESSKAGRYVFVLIPESAQLPKLNPGWHAVDKDLQSVLKVAKDLHQSGCGILGIPVRGLSPDNRQLWYACIEALLDLTVRLLPIDGETRVELNVEQRGVATADQNELLQKTVDDVMYHLALVNPERAKEIHLTARFIEKYDIVEDGNFKTIRITLKYGVDKNEKVITGIKRISKPGLRVYAGKEEIPYVLGGLGIAILSTNQGIVTDKEACKLGVGGEVLAFVW